MAPRFQRLCSEVFLLNVLSIVAVYLSWKVLQVLLLLRVLSHQFLERKLVKES